MRATLAALALAPLACFPVTALDVPEPGRAHVLAIADADGIREVHAYDAMPPLSLRDGDRLYALPFSCSLARLGLEPGVQSLGDTPTESDLLPPMARAYALSFSVGEANAWTELATRPPELTVALRSLPLPTTAACHAIGAQFSYVALSVPSDGRGPGAFVAAVSDTRAIAGTSDGRLYEIDTVAQEAIRRADLERMSSHRFAAATRGPEGELWMITDVGELFRGNLDGLRVVTSSAASPIPQQPAFALSASPPGVPFELFVSTKGGQHRRMSRYTDAGWQLTFTADGNGGEFFIPSVAWLAPGEAASNGGTHGIIRAKDGEMKLEQVVGSRDEVTLLARHPSLGTLAGTGGGEVMQDRGDGRWASLATTDTFYIRAIFPEGEGFVFVGSTNFNFDPSGWGQFYPATSVCPGFDRLSDFAVSHAARLSDTTFVAITLAGPNQPMGVSVITRTQEAESCVD